MRRQTGRVSGYYHGYQIIEATGGEFYVLDGARSVAVCKSLRLAKQVVRIEEKRKEEASCKIPA